MPGRDHTDAVPIPVSPQIEGVRGHRLHAIGQLECFNPRVQGRGVGAAAEVASVELLRSRRAEPAARHWQEAISSSGWALSDSASPSLGTRRAKAELNTLVASTFPITLPNTTKPGRSRFSVPQPYITTSPCSAAGRDHPLIIFERPLGVRNCHSALNRIRRGFVRVLRVRKQLAHIQAVPHVWRTSKGRERHCPAGVVCAEQFVRILIEYRQPLPFPASSGLGSNV